MASFEITLPDFNGEIEVGLAVGTDISLPTDIRLPALTKATLLAAAGYAAAWAQQKFSNKGNAVSNLMASAAIGIIMTGSLRKANNAPISDWLEIQNAAAESFPRVKPEIYTTQAIQNALTMVTTTKVMWWLTNHHTGGVTVSGYLSKVGAQILRDMSAEDYTQAAHTCGHWADTHEVLKAAGIVNLKRTERAFEYATVRLNLADNDRLRFASSPAGTHRASIAYASAKRLINTPLIKVFPGRSQLMGLPMIMDSINNAPAKYYIGASFLTGEGRAVYNDKDYESVLGRLGTFIRVIYPNSTLSKSPHLDKSKVESYNSDFFVIRTFS